MPAALFYLFAIVTLGFGAMVVICRNPVASALSLVLSFVGLAALFIGLDAYFIGIIQILVYAGAVMVLFLFIIMLLDIKAEEGRKPNVAAVVGGIALALVFGVQLAVILHEHKAGEKTLSEVPIDYVAAAEKAKIETIKNDLQEQSLPDAKLVGEELFHRYYFQIQLVGVLLLVSTVGVVIMSKKEVG
jgi:NADH-quinone oxidoreductase subunit J